MHIMCMDMRSKCTAHAWHVHGKCIACAWHMHGGTRMAHAKHVHGADVAHAWRMRSMCIEHASHVHGTCMAHATHVHRTCIACAKYMHSMCAANAQHVHCTWMSWNVVLRGCVTTEYTSAIYGVPAHRTIQGHARLRKRPHLQRRRQCDESRSTH